MVSVSISRKVTKPGLLALQAVGSYPVVTEMTPVQSHLTAFTEDCEVLVLLFCEKDIEHFCPYVMVWKTQEPPRTYCVTCYV